MKIAMIYLMESNNKVKIGYSKDCLSRLKQFKTGNPDIVLVDTKIGTKWDETNLHHLCDKWHITNEWFEKNQDVLDIWNNYDPWTTEDFEEMKSEVKTYSSYLIGALFSPTHPFFTLKGFDSVKNKVDEAIQHNIPIPTEVQEYMEYAVNILDVYAINAYIQHPMFDLPITTKWKKYYKLYNITLAIPYYDLLVSEYNKIKKDLKYLHTCTKLETFCLDNCSNEILSNSKQRFVNLTLGIEDAIKELEIKSERITWALDNIEKIIRED